MFQASVCGCSASLFCVSVEALLQGWELERVLEVFGDGGGGRGCFCSGVWTVCLLWAGKNLSFCFSEVIWVRSYLILDLI